MKPTNAVTHHAERRAQERWGVEISIDEIERQLASGEAEVYKRENPRIWGVLIRTAEGFVPIIYNRALKTVLTVLPRAELANIQEEYGRGFASKDASTTFWASLSRVRRKELTTRKDACDLDDPLYNAGTVRKAQKIMALVDSFPSDVRAIVHEHGHYIVNAFWDHSIRRAHAITTLIEASRKAKSASSPALAALYRHFGARTNEAAHFLATVARIEPPPKAPDANPPRLEKLKNRRNKLRQPNPLTRAEG